MSNSVLMILVCCSLAATLLSGCRHGDAELQSTSANGQSPVNQWAAREVSDAEVKEMEAAWNRFLLSGGMTQPEIDASVKGLSEHEIVYIEEAICMRLPADVRAFLKIYLTGGKNFTSLWMRDKPQEIASEWLYQVDLAYGGHAVLGFDLPADHAASFPRHHMWFEAFLLPIMNDRHLYEVYIDVRNGRVVDSYDNDPGDMARSLAELFNEIAAHQEAGRLVTDYCSEEHLYERESIEVCKSILKAYTPLKKNKADSDKAEANKGEDP